MSGCWNIFGLRIRSELPLAGQMIAEECDADVVVRVGAVPPMDGYVSVAADGALQFAVPDVGRYRIANGGEIVIEPAAGASSREISVYLLGSALGAILHQRRILPLHANAIVINGEAVAFLGPSGSGKSTLAGWFHEQGHGLLSDDVCAIRFEGGAPMVLPGVERLRLWDDSVGLIGRGPQPPDGEAKHEIPVQLSQAAPLAACYVIEDGAEDVPLAVERLAGVAAVAALVANTYRGRFASLLGSLEWHTQACVSLAHHVAVYRLTRSKRRAEFQADARTIERHAIAVTAGS